MFSIKTISNYLLGNTIPDLNQEKKKHACRWLVVPNPATPWTAAYHSPLSSTVSLSLLKCMSIETVTLSNHLTLCHPLLLLPSISLSIRVSSNELAFRIKWAKY